MPNHIRSILPLLSLALLAGCGSGDIDHIKSTSATLSSVENSVVRAREVESPSDFNGEEVTPRVTPDFHKPIPTNDWWTSLLWPFYPGNNFGENLYAQPMVFKAQPEGLAIGYPNEATVTPDDVHYTYHFRNDMRVGVSGLSATEVRVEDYSDWTVTPRWKSGSTWMSATIGHGLLFSYFRTNSTQARATFAGPPVVFAQTPGALGVVVNGQAYGLFAPGNENWSVQGEQATASLGGHGYFSVALLPSAEQSVLEEFRQRAFSFVTDTQVSWELDGGVLKTRYELETQTLEGTPQDPAIALYRHQWLRTNKTMKDWSFTTARGEMKGFFGSDFVTERPFTGVLPNLPLPSGVDRSLMDGFLNEVAAEGPLTDKDTYFGGKDLGKLSQLIPIAEQMGRRDLMNLWLDQIQSRLDDYFDGQKPYRFVYNDLWDTLLADPVAFESDKYLNDHHFHYGYLVMGSATLARYRPAWAAQNRAAVEEMILDVANPDRGNSRYPFLRNFDPYAGHSWASGAQNFAGGNNQESSSESMHFASAVILWGTETGQPDLVELGAYLYATEADAIWQYWFDKDDAVFPQEFEHPVLGIVWSGGGAYATWWTANEEEIHGINFLPVHAGSLYLGHYPEALAENLNHLRAQAGQLVEWRDIIWSALAFVEPSETLNSFLQQRPVPEGGESRAHTYHWLSSLAELGTPRPDVVADSGSFAVFEKDETRTYLAYNADDSAREVTFSDGFRMTVQGNTLGRASGASGPAPEEPGPVGPGPEEPSPTGGSLPDRLAERLTVAGAEGGHWVGEAHNGETLRYENITAVYDGTALGFVFPVDSGTAVANAVQVQFRFDFQGDGSFDRVETYHYFPTDDRPGVEFYDEKRGLLRVIGDYADLVGGTVEVEFWSPIGRASSVVEAEGSVMSWPFSGSETPVEPSPPSEPPVSGGTDSVAVGPVALVAGDGFNHDGQPYKALAWELDGLSGEFLESQFEFVLPVDSGRSVANAVQARLSYDFDGSGSYDRVTTFGYFATNDVEGVEEYRSSAVGSRSEGADFRAFVGGSAKLEVWSALGSGVTRIGEGVLRINR